MYFRNLENPDIEKKVKEDKNMDLDSFLSCRDSTSK